MLQLKASSSWALFAQHLAQDAWPHAWPQLQQQTYQPRQRTTLRLHMLPILQIEQLPSQQMCLQHHQQHSQHLNGIHC